MAFNEPQDGAPRTPPADPEAAFEILSEGIGRRDLLRASAAIGLGAVAPAWMFSPGVEDAVAAATGDGPGPRVLQSGPWPAPRPLRTLDTRQRAVGLSAQP